MFGRIAKFLHSTSIEKRLFFKALFYSVKYRIITSLFPFKYYVSDLGISQTNNSTSPTNNQLLTITSVYKAVRRSSIYLPFGQKCLIEAIVAKQLLKQHNISSTLYLGVSRDNNRQLIAHAWLKCGDYIVTGRKGSKNFSVVEYYT